MKVHILISGDLISYYFFYPILAGRRVLRQDGIDFCFVQRDEELEGAQTAIIDHRVFSSMWRDRREEGLKRLGHIRARCGRLIWADVSDSTGATQFQVLPLVDLYWKKQLLRDRRQYLRSYFGARVYTAFYRERFDLPDDDAYRCEPAAEDQLHKLRVAWNLGLGPCHQRLGWNLLLQRLPVEWRMRFSGGAARFHAGDDRPQPVCFRGTDRYNNRALAQQRLLVLERLRARGLDTTPLGYTDYRRELRRSLVGVSPFGAGEICFRDFEIMLNGAALFKPDMNHLETWPDLFRDGETCRTFAWDLSDFDLKLDDLITRPDEARALRDRAQEEYRAVLSPAGRAGFAQRFRQLAVETAQEEMPACSAP